MKLKSSAGIACALAAGLLLSACVDVYDDSPSMAHAEVIASAVGNNCRLGGTDESIAEIMQSMFKQTAADVAQMRVNAAEVGMNECDYMQMRIMEAAAQG